MNFVTESGPKVRLQENLNLILVFRDGKKSVTEKLSSINTILVVFRIQML